MIFLLFEQKAAQTMEDIDYCKDIYFYFFPMKYD